MYRLTNSVNGRVYVGKTANPARRLYEHRRSPPKRLRHDLQLLGKTFNDVIDFTVTHRVATMHAASHFEERDILLTDSRSHARGYNNLRGGSVQTDSKYRYLKFRKLI